MAAGQFFRSPFSAAGRFMVWLSTANVEVLQRFPADRPKYVGLGSSVFITSSMAAISGGFALRMGLKLPIAACVVAGFLWGMAIMGLDRWLLATASRSNRWLLLPRAGLAILIGVVVSTPFVLRIFQPEISQQVALIQARDATGQQQSWNDPANPIVARINQLAADVDRQNAVIQTGGSTISAEDDPTVQQLLKALSPDIDPMKTYNDLNRKILCEEAGNTNCGDGTGSGRPGDGFRTEQLKQQAAAYFDLHVKPLNNQLQNARLEAGKNLPATRAKAVQDARDKLAADTRELNPLRDRRSRLQAAFENSNGGDTGLLIRMQALGELTRNNPTMRTTHYVLLAFVTAIDCLPILFKLLMSLGRRNRYEEGLEAEEQEHLAISRQRSRHLRAEQMIFHSDTLREAQAARDERDEAIEELARRTVRDQVEVAERALDRWKREQLHHVETDPDYLNREWEPAPTVLPPHQRRSGHGSNGVDGVTPPPREWPPRERERPPSRVARVWRRDDRLVPEPAAEAPAVDEDVTNHRPPADREPTAHTTPQPDRRVSAGSRSPTESYPPADETQQVDSNDLW
ncbi:DUF4407 domain-containing protein [Frankia sp. AgB32]|uniref:DUF4407 domain-containing protein n=1 Tax=Frankia sp. AgB32 TaxID=631119 RepID=UPI00200EEE8E|nr:DUF4407 domain-containing protein [Frankia sp. AgB32]